jgi:hypothetical protein
MKTLLVCSVLSLAVITGCNSDNVNSIPEQPTPPIIPEQPIEPIDALPQSYLFTVGDKQHIDLTSAVKTNAEWSLSTVTDDNGLGVISNQTPHGFDYVAGIAGMTSLSYEVQTSNDNAWSKIFAYVNDKATPENTPPLAENITLTVMNNATVSVDLRHYMSDSDNDALTIDKLVQSSNRFTLDKATNILTFTPSGFVGVDQAMFSVEDGQGGYAIAYVIVTSKDANPIAPNTAPVAKNYSKNVDSATTPVWDIDLTQLKLISDANGDALHIDRIFNSNNRAVKLSDTVIRYTPANFTGVDQFTFVVTDNKGGYAAGTLTVTVSDSTPLNQAPKATVVTMTDAPFDADSIINVSANVSDTDNDTLRIINVIGANGKAVINPSNPLEINYTPLASNQEGDVDNFGYVVTDSKGGYAMSTVSIAFKAKPKPPPPPAALPVLTKIAVIGTPVVGTTLIPDVACDNCVDANTQFNWIVNGLTASTAPQYIYQAADQGADIKLSVSALNTDNNAVDGYSTYTPDAVSTVAAAPFAFAALKNDKTVVTWGGDGVGGDSATVAAQLTDVKSITASESAFAALKNDGSVVTWGHADWGGDSSTIADQLTDVKAIFANKYEFAAVKTDGSVVTWGWTRGEPKPTGLTGVNTIFSTQTGFAALKNDKTVVTWGVDGGDSSAVTSQLVNVTTIKSTVRGAFAALKNDGSVVTWGEAIWGGDSSAVTAQLTDVKSIYSNRGAFAALKNDGSVVTWGISYGGGDSSSVKNQLTDVKSIHANGDAFAALKADGSVVAWGHQNWGGNTGWVSGQLTSGVTDISATLSMFAALKNDGSVVEWGDYLSDCDMSTVASKLKSGVKSISTSRGAFAALKTDGSVVTWGDCTWGGDSSAVAAQLTSNVAEVFANDYSFVALKTDGSVVTWGAWGKSSGNDFVGELIAMPSSKLKASLVLKDSSIN